MNVVFFELDFQSQPLYEWSIFRPVQAIGADWPFPRHETQRRATELVHLDFLNPACQTITLSAQENLLNFEKSTQIMKW
jgi:hypothetical protein